MDGTGSEAYTSATEADLLRLPGGKNVGVATAQGWSGTPKPPPVRHWNTENYRLILANDLCGQRGMGTCVSAIDDVPAVVETATIVDNVVECVDPVLAFEVDRRANTTRTLSFNRAISSLN